jgi:hypothetical protein
VSIPEGAIVIEVESPLQGVKNVARVFLVAAKMDSGTKSRVASHLPSLLRYAPWPGMEVTVAA